MSFFTSFLPTDRQGGGCFGEPGGLNKGDVLGTIGGVFGLGTVWTAVGTALLMQDSLRDIGYRPRTWQSSLADPLQMVLVQTNISGLFFDGVMSTETEEQLTITSHPVQSGANISDHAYREPTRISMEIFMSDVMASRQPGQFNSYVDKSVSAYRRLLDLQRSRIPVSVHTRLGTYQNMLIETISAPDDASTRDGLRCTVTLREVLVAKVGVTKVSAREWTTGTGTNAGEVVARETPKTVLVKMGAKGTGGSQGVRT
jgi:hypothetical protein